MKFLTFVDLHDDKKYLKELVQRASKDDIDFVVCAGDVSQFGRGLIAVLEQFNSLGKKMYIIPGNHENDAMLKKVNGQFSNIINFHQDAVEIGDYVFLGYGEGGFVFEDAEFRKVARHWYGKYNGRKIVFVTHGPPFGTAVDKIDQKYVGNKDFSQFIQRILPKLVICGHLHETANKTDQINKVRIINPGWEGMVVELQ